LACWRRCCLAAVDAGAEIAVGSRPLADSRIDQRQAWLAGLAGKAFGGVRTTGGSPYS